VKLLHTADWHVGRTIRGRTRADEHRGVLDEIVGIARDEVVDLVIVAGDLFDVSAPSPESEDIVYRALLDLASTGADVVVIAGNHDHPGRLAAVRPLLNLTRVRTAAFFERPGEGGVARIRTRTGAKVRVAMLPFLSQRTIVKADVLMAQDAADHVQHYADRFRRITSMLCDDFDAECINIIAAHATVVGARLGGGEREAHTLDDYHITAGVFPANAHYVALGHVHRAQRIHGACPIWYAGSPLQLDFGETANTPRVLIAEMAVDMPAQVREIPLASGRRLRTVRGLLAELEARRDEFGDDYLRLELTDVSASGLADTARAAFPDAVDIRIARDDVVDTDDAAWTLDQVRRSPVELFAEYLVERGLQDPALTRLFNELFADAAEHG
jgi:exonuclease SbcD